MNHDEKYSKALITREQCLNYTTPIWRRSNRCQGIGHVGENQEYLDVLSEKLYLRKGISVHNALFRARIVRI